MYLPQGIGQLERLTEHNLPGVLDAYSGGRRPTEIKVPLDRMGTLTRNVLAPDREDVQKELLLYDLMELGEKHFENQWNAPRIREHNGVYSVELPTESICYFKQRAMTTDTAYGEYAINTRQESPSDLVRAAGIGKYLGPSGIRTTKRLLRRRFPSPAELWKRAGI
ncbi:TPA: hypothetical protein HA278_01795 [Candidatus Woesearchaeota archaeon]|nr:hypothetical protein [archaeon]HIJ10767.1 hypothetical protein [Candidatus Woesearchaeota archaeon]